MLETLQSLPAGQKDAFASGFQKLSSKLQSRTGETLARRHAMPAELPRPYLNQTCDLKLIVSVD